MSTRDEAWPEGTPAWADLAVPDRHVARDFYGGVFGWDFDEGPAEMGYYTNCLKDGRTVAGIGEPPPGGEAPPAAWTTYLAVEDADRVADRVTQAGGTAMMPPMDVGDFGRMAVLTDPTGAVFGLWQAGSHRGAGVVNEPGAMVWNELMTRDVEAAKAFYAQVFGYELEDMSGPGFTYFGLKLGEGEVVGGIGGLDDSAPAEVPSHWGTYFAVADADATVERITAHGGTVLSAPQDTPFGRIAAVSGPSGEQFSVIAMP